MTDDLILCSYVWGAWTNDTIESNQNQLRGRIVIDLLRCVMSDAYALGSLMKSRGSMCASFWNWWARTAHNCLYSVIHADISLFVNESCQSPETLNGISHSFLLSLRCETQTFRRISVNKPTLEYVQLPFSHIIEPIDFDVFHFPCVK